MRPFSKQLVLASLVSLSATAANAGTVSFSDPKGDDVGPGTYVYPTKADYKKGSFDLTSLEIKDKGADLEIEITVNASIDDPWDSAKWPTPGNGFSLQMFQLYIDVDGKAGSGEANTLPGMNATFADDSRWEKVVFISPQANKEITSRLEQKAKAMKANVVLPTKVSAKGKKVTAIVKKADIGAGFDPAKAGFQILVASNEGYDNQPQNGILARTVNEFEGEHRFGGGDDGDSDPHFVDVLAGAGKGGDDEVAAQKTMLSYDAKKKQKAVLKMVRAK
ncbi:MAG TPA: glucodextranase DOMON-like domain-containing protein [Myxococcota bacterium]